MQHWGRGIEAEFQLWVHAQQKRITASVNETQMETRKSRYSEKDPPKNMSLAILQVFCWHKGGDNIKLFYLNDLNVIG